MALTSASLSRDVKRGLAALVLAMGCAHGEAVRDADADVWTLHFFRSSNGFIPRHEDLVIRDDGLVCGRGRLSTELAAHVRAVVIDEALPWIERPSWRERRFPRGYGGCTFSTYWVGVMLIEGKTDSRTAAVGVLLDHDYIRGDPELRGRIEALWDYISLVAEETQPTADQACIDHEQRHPRRRRRDFVELAY